jgi:hypothetical protein
MMSDLPYFQPCKVRQQVPDLRPLLGLPDYGFSVGLSQETFPSLGRSNPVHHLIRCHCAAVGLALDKLSRNKLVLAQSYPSSQSSENQAAPGNLAIPVGMRGDFLTEFLGRCWTSELWWASEEQRRKSMTLVQYVRARVVIATKGETGCLCC